ncbi:MAG: hypothetical protein P9M07_02125 [Candidatus Aceula meridiana]|nr:hypothetical protein [Candidatus Aceula meridiana]
MIKQISKKQTGFLRGQTLLEYAFLAVVVMVALMVVQRYVQRGMQGKWMDSLSSLDSQYDPQADIQSNHYTEAESRTVTSVEDGGGGGVYTQRTDTSNMNEIVNEIVTVTY